MSKEEKLTEQAEKIEQEATEHCNKVLCSVCEKVACTKEIKCREWRDRRAGYYCGAEPKEERIAELIKENQYLRDNYDQFKAIAEPEIERLQKENAELKADYEVLSCSVGDFGELQDKLEEEQRKNNGLSDNLTKAKDLLNEFMRISKASDEDFEHDYSELIGETEQFLKEVEK